MVERSVSGRAVDHADAELIVASRVPCARFWLSAGLEHVTRVAGRKRMLWGPVPMSVGYPSRHRDQIHSRSRCADGFLLPVAVESEF